MCNSKKNIAHLNVSRILYGSIESIFIDSVWWYCVMCTMQLMKILKPIKLTFYLKRTKFAGLLLSSRMRCVTEEIFFLFVFLHCRFHHNLQLIWFMCHSELFYKKGFQWVYQPELKKTAQFVKRRRVIKHSFSASGFNVRIYLFVII